MKIAKKSLKHLPDGFDAKFGGSYNEYMVKSQIIVPKSGLGHDLRKFCTLSEVVVDSDKIEEMLFIL